MAGSEGQTLILIAQYGMTELQGKAYNEIVSRLTPQNVVQEAFSSFFSR